MTDKQIIIDGVDVSKCSYFQQEDDEYTCGAEECNGAIVACRACDNCYYKQLKRKEQECERLKKWLPIVTRLEEQFKSHEKAKGIDYKTYAEQVFTELDQLKSENKHLNDLLNQALKELEAIQDAYEERE
jgi:hypothetical protein